MSNNNRDAPEPESTLEYSPHAREKFDVAASAEWVGRGITVTPGPRRDEDQQEDKPGLKTAPFLMLNLLGIGLESKKGGKRGKPTGSRWVTDHDGHHLLIGRGGNIIAGRGIQAGATWHQKPKPGAGSGGGGGGAATAKPAEASKPAPKPAAAAKPEPAKPAVIAKPVAQPEPAKPKPESTKPVATAKPEPKPAAKPEPPKPAAEPAKPAGPARDLADAPTKEINAHHKTMSEDWRKGLSDDEKTDVGYYTSHLFDKINAYNRTGDAGDFSKKTLAKMTGNIDKSLNRSALKEDTILYRGVGDLRHLGLDTSKSLVGHEFHEKSYSSTSLNRKVAENFVKRNVTAQPKQEDHGAILRIRAVAGTKAASMGGISRFEKEHEVLLARNAKFKVTGESRDSKGRRVLDLEVHHGD